MKRLFVDMDGTLAKFHDEPIYLERMYEEGFFKSLKPFENMVNGIKEFIKMHPDVEVYVLSSAIDSPYCVKEKNAWIEKHLPEISLERRIYPIMGTSKAESIFEYTGIPVTKNDFLVDDYNTGLYDWEINGGTGIKCHNNINQKGLGLYGGQKGQLWVKAMVHTDDLPIMIASELSAHMELHFDFKPIFDAYGITNINQSKYANPLDTIRFMRCKGNFREFEPVVLEIGEPSDIKKDLCIMPIHKYNAIISNFNNKTISAPEFWREVLNNSQLPKILDSALATIPKPSLENIIKSADENNAEVNILGNHIETDERGK